MSQDNLSIKNTLTNVVSLEAHESKLSPLAESQSKFLSSSLSLSTADLEFPQSSSPAPDLVCLSHLRWNFVYQRPQHLLTRCAKKRRVFVIEEPIFDAAQDGKLDIIQHESG